MVAMIDAVTHNVESSIFSLQNGPIWRSFDRFKHQGAHELEQRLPEGQIGRLNVKGGEFVIVRADTWNQVYGLARDVSRFKHGVSLVKEAVKLFLHVENDPEGSKVAVGLLRELSYHMPYLPTEGVPDRALVFTEEERASVDDDLDFDLRPMDSTHPSFVRELGQDVAEDH